MNKITITLNGRQVAIECETGNEVVVSLTGDGFKFAFSKIETVKPVAPEDEEVSVSIINPGANKIQTIKAVRMATSLGLGESKNLMETGAPFTIVGADKIKEFRRECAQYNINARISKII